MKEVLRLRREALDWLSVEDEVVALDAKASVYLAANPTGAMLWEALAKGTTRGELVELLVDTYGVEAETARSDLDVFLDQLQERDLLEREGQAGTD